MRTRFGAIALVAVLVFTGCGEGEFSIELPTVGPDNLQTVASELRPEVRRARAALVRDSAAVSGLTNGVLLAGIADAETNFAHCWSEARWACKGPASSSCDGGPVIAGSADGPCSARQGGLGMFQFDAGTYSQTLQREGHRILTVEGNTQAAVEFVVDKVRRSQFVPGIDTDAEALAWMNALRPGTREWDQWIRTVTGYYNGCFEGRCSVFYERYNNYDSKTRNILAEYGEEFWRLRQNDPGSGGSSPGGSSGTPGGSSQPVSTAPAVATELGPGNVQVPLQQSVTLQWQSPGATHYTVRMEYFEGSQWAFYYEWQKNRNSFEVWPQNPNRQYRWAVKACNSVGCADWSNYQSFVYGDVSGTQPTDDGGGTSDDGGSSSGGSTSGGSSSGGSGSSTPPPAQSGVPGMPASMRPAGVRIDTPQVPLTWSEPAGAEWYDVVMYYNSNGSWVDYYVWEGRRGGAFEVWPVIDETYYAWAIRACNATGCSEWSDFQQFYFAGL